MNTHDYTLIDGNPVLHSTAVRDYVCGSCGNGLVTLFLEGEWRTVCSTCRGESFIKKNEWLALETKMKVRAEHGREVFDHLPEEIQRLIKGEIE